MTDILKLARVQVVLIVLFIFFKIIRPSVLQSSSPEFFKIILLSLPNFFEAITGTLVLTGIGLLVNDKWNKKHRLKPKSIYVLAVIFSGVYVTLQELEIVNFRSHHTFDYFDLVFSFIGLVVGFCIVSLIKPRVTAKSKSEIFR